MLSVQLAEEEEDVLGLGGLVVGVRVNKPNLGNRVQEFMNSRLWILGDMPLVLPLNGQLIHPISLPF